MFGSLSPSIVGRSSLFTYSERFLQQKKESLTSFKFYKGYEEVNNFTLHRSDQLENVKNFTWTMALYLQLWHGLIVSLAQILDTLSLFLYLY